MSESCCQITDNAFSDQEARHEVRQYRRHGPAPHTRELLRAVRSLGLRDAALLDVGGGVGVIYHELLSDTAGQATHVDASSAYLRMAREETARRGQADRVNFIHADFTDVASSLPAADIVTLDRVVCCYPDFQALLGAAAAHARHALALTYPRDTWYWRLGLRLIDLVQRMRRDPFRVFLHPVAQMSAFLEARGMRRIHVKRLFVWEIALYVRA